ncbi:MAG: DUF4360 domain-containing protein [Silvanigrellales bacterium]|nr:DUF4360 domain-containing protein [Silvanigrellales bacterium]
MFASKSVKPSRFVLAASSVALVAGLGNLFLAGTALATPQPEILGTSFQGTGCDDTNAFAEVTPDGKVDLLFLGLEAVTDSTQVRARKNCVANIKVKVPEGYQIAPKTVFFDGQTRVSPEGSSSVTARYWLAAAPSSAALASFPGGSEQVVSVLSPDASLNASSWTQCGGEVNLRAMADLIARRGEHETEQSEMIVTNGGASLGRHKISCQFVIRPCGH